MKSSSILALTVHLFICSCILLDVPEIRANTEIFDLATLCKGQYPGQMHRKIDGAVIISKNEKNLDCTITFSAEYVSQRFLITFEEFNMECSDRLYIYDSANAISNPRADLNCRYSTDNIKPIKTRGHYVTLKFIADAWGMDDHRFKMIITAYKDTNQGCFDSFLCAQDNMCISNRLLCDNINNCMDGIDELRSANCSGNFLRDLFSPQGDSTTGIILICGLLVISSVIVLFCLCGRNKNSRAQNSNTTIQNNTTNHHHQDLRMTSMTSTSLNNHTKMLNEVAGGSNGAGSLKFMKEKSGLRSLQTHSTLESLHKSGNLHLPAVSKGYLTMLTDLHQCFRGI